MIQNELFPLLTESQQPNESIVLSQTTPVLSRPDSQSASESTASLSQARVLILSCQDSKSAPGAEPDLSGQRVCARLDLLNCPDRRSAPDSIF